MRKVQCINRHYYDADKSELCPHCGAVEAVGGTDGRREGMASGAAPWPGGIDAGYGGHASGGNTGAEAAVSTPTKGQKEKRRGRLFSWGRGREEDERSGRNGSESRTDGKGAAECGAAETEKSSAPGQPDMQKTVALSEAELEAAAVTEELSELEKCSYDNGHERLLRSVSGTAIDEVKTVSAYTDENGAEPVTGWLVAVNGEYYGQGFSLRTGKNFIGRDASMDVRLSREASVSRIRHALIVFDPKHCIFLLSGGEGSGLTYCNDELVLGMVQLKAYDRLQFGEAEFVFAPFCGGQFRWERG